MPADVYSGLTRKLPVRVGAARSGLGRGLPATFFCLWPVALVQMARAARLILASGISPHFNIGASTLQGFRRYRRFRSEFSVIFKLPS